MNAIIETERLYFRELLATDDAGIFELDADPEVHQYLGKHPIVTIEQARKVIKFIRDQYSANGIGRLAIVEKESNNFVGWGGFKLITEPVNGHQDYYDLGYRFIKRYWGKGYATESTKGAIEYGFNVLKLQTIYAIADEDNLASKKVLKKCGFVYKSSFEYENTPHDWFELTPRQPV